MAQKVDTLEKRFVHQYLLKNIGGEFFMIGRRCKSCGSVSLLPKAVPVCHNCFVEGQIEEVTLSKRGKLFSYAVQNIALPGFEAPSPMGYIDLPEGLRVFSLLTECEPFKEKLKIGREMEMTVKKVYKDKEGNDFFSYTFKPI